MNNIRAMTRQSPSFLLSKKIKLEEMRTLQNFYLFLLYIEKKRANFLGGKTASSLRTPMARWYFNFGAK